MRGFLFCTYVAGLATFVVLTSSMHLLCTRYQVTAAKLQEVVASELRHGKDQGARAAS
jgi:hypothetical protein